MGKSQPGVEAADDRQAAITWGPGLQAFEGNGEVLMWTTGKGGSQEEDWATELSEQKGKETWGQHPSRRDLQENLDGGPWQQKA